MGAENTKAKFEIPFFKKVEKFTCLKIDDKKLILKHVMDYKRIRTIIIEWLEINKKLTEKEYQDHIKKYASMLYEHVPETKQLVCVSEENSQTFPVVEVTTLHFILEKVEDYQKLLDYLNVFLNDFRPEQSEMIDHQSSLNTVNLNNQESNLSQTEEDSHKQKMGEKTYHNWAQQKLFNSGIISFEESQTPIDKFKSFKDPKNWKSDEYLWVAGEGGTLKKISYSGDDDFVVHDYEDQHKSLPITSMAITKSGNYLYTAGLSGHINKWSISDNKLLATLKAGSESKDQNILTMVISFSDCYLFTSGRGGYLNQWQINAYDDTLKEDSLYKFWGKVNQNNTNCVAITPDDKYLFAAGGDNDGILNQYTISDQSHYKIMGKYDDCIQHIAISSNGLDLFIADFAGNIFQLDIESGDQINCFNDSNNIH